MSQPHMNMSLVGLLVIAALVAIAFVVVVGVARGRRGGWTILAGAGGMVVVVAVVFALAAFFFVGRRVVVSRGHATASLNAENPRQRQYYGGTSGDLVDSVPPPVRTEVILDDSAAVVEARPAWDLGEGEFEASVYASAASAGKAAALGVIKSLATIAPGGEEDLTIGLAGGLASDAIGEAVREREARVGRVVRLEGVPSTQPAVVLSVEVVSEGSYTAYGANLRNGTVTAVLRGPGGQTSRSAAFDEKGWNDDFAQFVNRNQDRHWYLAESRSPATTVREAEELAFQDAARQLLPYFRHVAQRQNSVWSQASDGALAELIRGELRRGMFVADRFVQQFDRPYGQVWRAMLLVYDREDAAAYALMSQSGREQFARTPEGRAGYRARVTWFSAVGMAVLIVAVYGFLNAATKGYYAWSLRVAAAVLVLAGVALVLVLA